MTCWRRLRGGRAAGVWSKLHHRILVKLDAKGAIDWSSGSVDSSPSARLLLGAPGRSVPLSSRARLGSKHHLLADGTGLPLNVTLTGGNRHDVTQLLPLADSMRPVAGKVGRRRAVKSRFVV